MTDAYRAILARRVPGDKQRRTFAELIAARVVAEAMDGSVRAAAEIADRSEGRARQAPEPERHDTGSLSLREDFSNLTGEELVDRVIKVVLSIEKTAEIAGFKDRLVAARAERAEAEAGGYYSLTLTEPGERPSS